MSDEEIIDLRDALLPSQGEPFDALVFGRAIAAAAVAKERERIFLLAKSRADYEASAAAHHASWHSAHEYHMNRYAGMSDLIGALRLRKNSVTQATPQPPAAS